MSSQKTRPTSDAARKRMSESKLALYDTAAQKRIEQTREVMKVIQKEMSINQGIYPHNKGAISAAEVARRCGYHPATLHKDRYVELRKELQSWLHKLKDVSVVGKISVRKEQAQRTNEWKELYNNLAEAHRISETELTLAQARIIELEQKIRRLDEELAHREKLKIVPIGRSQKKQ